MVCVLGEKSIGGGGWVLMALRERHARARMGLMSDTIVLYTTGICTGAGNLSRMVSRYKYSLPRTEGNSIPSTVT